jgi:hypothetical protein
MRVRLPRETFGDMAIASAGGATASTTEWEQRLFGAQLKETSG